MLHSGDEGGMERDAATLDHDVPEIKHQIRPCQPPALANQVRPPPYFEIGQDYETWKFQMQFFIQGLSDPDKAQHIMMSLSLEVLRRVRCERLPLNASAAEIWLVLDRFFGTPQNSKLFIEKFWNRNQLPGESISDYLLVLRGLTQKSFQWLSADKVDLMVRDRLISGVKDPELKKRFLREPPETLEKAVLLAQNWEAVDELLDSPTQTNLNCMAITPKRKKWSPPVRRGWNESRWQLGARTWRGRGRTTAGNQSFHVLPVTVMQTLNVSPLFISGELNGLSVKLLIDTGASCSLVSADPCGRLRCTVNQVGTKVVAAKGATLHVGSSVDLFIKFSDIASKHTFLVSPDILWDAILGMDFLQQHDVVLDTSSRIISNRPLDKVVCGVESGDAQSSVEGDIPPRHVREMLGHVTDGVELSSLQKQLSEFTDMFDCNGGTGRTTVTQHTIDTGDQGPIWQHPRRIPIHYQNQLEEMIQDMLKRGIIRPSSSSWASPVVLVKKKDGSLRLCVDYRKLNALTKKDTFPLPRIDTTLDALSGAKWFSTLDLASGYW